MSRIWSLFETCRFYGLEMTEQIVYLFEKYRFKLERREVLREWTSTEKRGTSTDEMLKSYENTDQMRNAEFTARWVSNRQRGVRSVKQNRSGRYRYRGRMRSHFAFFCFGSPSAATGTRAALHFCACPYSSHSTRYIQIICSVFERGVATITNSWARTEPTHLAPLRNLALLNLHRLYLRPPTRRGN